ncbi:MAG: TonB-dependent receptor [Prevotellaceae bacterium]|nr:TonB-dependent receptor [Prevotellaceae bacterium]
MGKQFFLKINKRKRCLLFSFLLLSIPASAQREITVSGTVSDSRSPLAGAVIVPQSTRAGVESNADGRYTLRLLPGSHALTVSYIGYTTLDTTVVLRHDTVIHFHLREAGISLKEVVISAERPNTNVIRPEMGFEKLDNRQIRQIPALMGEVDIIKVIQLLPGVQAASEGTSGFSVRGGSPDQNLILFENATLYNASHLMGFFSVFNNDAVEDITLYKGDIPAQYGGRLSSLLEVTSRSGKPEFSGSAGIGLIASRLMLQGPLVNSRCTFLLAGRRTYADIFLPLAGEENLRRVDIHFYDLNAKLQARIDGRNELSATGYYGRDIFKNGDMGMNFSNTAYTLRWKHLFSSVLFSHIELLGSHYDYNMEATTPSLTGVWDSDINDNALRVDFTYQPHERHSFRFGYNSTYHRFAPGDGAGLLPDGKEYPIHLAKKQAWENALYFTNRHTVGALTARYGLRLTRFDNIGPTTDYRVNEQYAIARGDTMTIASGRFYNHYYGIEPRAGLVWAFGEAWSLKASYAHTIQFLHLLTMSTAGSPLDIWVPSNLSIKPETARQAAVGVFANFFDNALETSVEVYYKWLSNVIDFKDHPEVLMNDVVETEIRTGSGRNYGVELVLRKNDGRFTGWISYTWSRAFRTIPEINGGRPYSSPFDRPHNTNIVLSYEWSKRLSASLNWIYATGQPVTFPEAFFQFGNDRIPVYTQRNTYRFPAYHRLDASLTIRLGRLAPDKRWRHELNISVYNLYGRKNPWTISFRTENDGISQYARMTYLFGIVPSVTYNVSFN